MKKFLSLLLALLFCLSFVVSCEKEEAPSTSEHSSSSDVSSSSEASSSDMPSSSEPTQESASEPLSSDMPSSSEPTQEPTSEPLSSENSSSTSGEEQTSIDEEEIYKGIEPDDRVLMAPNQPHYYYMTPQYSCLTPYKKIGAFVMDDYEALQDEFSKLGVNTTRLPLESVYVTEAVFETHYVFLLINYDISVKGNPAKTIGYRDVFKIDEYKYGIYADVSIEAESIRLDFDGMATYMILDNSSLIVPQDITCRLLLIPKEELPFAPLDGELWVYYTVYPN